MHQNTAPQTVALQAAAPQTPAPQSTGSKLLPRPPDGAQQLPQLSQLPETVLRLHLARGEIERLGPGYCVTGCAQLPEARLLAHQGVLLPGTVLARLSAAWVWGALPEAPTPVQLNTKPGITRVPGWHRAPQHQNPRAQLFYARYRASELETYAGFTVVGPKRTLLDLLFNHSLKTHSAARLASHSLLRLLQLSPDGVRHELAARKHPRKQRALKNLELL